MAKKNVVMVGAMAEHEGFVIRAWSSEQGKTLYQVEKDGKPVVWGEKQGKTPLGMVNEVKGMIDGQ